MDNKNKIYYLDEENNLVEKENAKKTIIRETDDKGNLVCEVFGFIDKNHEYDKYNMWYQAPKKDDEKHK